MALICASCGREARRPAIDVALTVLCARCAPDLGMDVGEHSPVRTLDDWKRRAAGRQAGLVGVHG